MTRRGLKFLRWWRRTSTGFRVLMWVGILIVAALGMYYLQRPSEDSPAAGSNLLAISIVNINIILLCVLAFLIGRNIVKLVFDRKRNILGSKLRMRLVVAFGGMALVTTLILFVFAGGLLSRAMQGWFSSQIEASVSGAKDVAKYHYNFIKESTERSANRVRERVENFSGDNRELSSLLEKLRVQDELYSIRIYSEDKHEIGVSENAAAVIESFSEPKPDSRAFDKALRKTPSVLFEEKESSHFIRAYQLISFKGSPAVLVATNRLNPELSYSLSIVNDSFKDYGQLKLSKDLIKTGYLLTLLLITGVILFSAIWFGFYLAKQISVPIQQLAEATRVVARGNYDFQIRAVGDDEIGFLVKSFNTMISDLKSSRTEAERRRLFIEAVLQNLAVGVIVIDRAHRVTAINPAASKLFELDSRDPQGELVSEVISKSTHEELQPLIAQIESDEKKESEALPERELTLTSGGLERRIICTGGRLTDGKGNQVGVVLLFDDITELSKAQHMAAWREVARRIAHEIKNPLTPIQLSAQRLMKMADEVRTNPALHECARTIVENVDSIKTLANEFTNFARMPVSDFKPGNLNSLISEVVALYAGNHPQIVFQFIGDTKIPEMMMDREQIRRTLINLVDNAISALTSEPSTKGEPGRIVIKTNFDSNHRSVLLEVSDNGPGISNPDKLRIFEPYFTTKRGGTGLGLAIVTTIISDHQGGIRVFDNKPRGAKFLVELPCDPKAVTQRRLANL